MVYPIFFVQQAKELTFAAIYHARNMVQDMNAEWNQ